ncbi:hypothetical protein DPMN_163852 [Dreissena polymorpha]|uniref:Uncharacterized protein n=1 Tax=Dreissena polymorpha TaxID=45954 RepID=A0A9D4EU27_DREPO|nr:hypothetical protein DPMN_163852 [Dreissena polymorpha]
MLGSYVDNIIPCIGTDSHLSTFEPYNSQKMSTLSQQRTFNLKQTNSLSLSRTISDISSSIHTQVGSPFDISTFENKHTKLYAIAELNVELEFRASSTFKKKCTTLYPNVEMNVELECRASSSFKN